MGEFCVVASPPLQVWSVCCMWKASVRKVGPNVRQPTTRHPELVSGSVGGTRVKEKRFRTKFGMTREGEG